MRALGGGPFARRRYLNTNPNRAGLLPGGIPGGWALSQARVAPVANGKKWLPRVSCVLLGARPLTLCRCARGICTCGALQEWHTWGRCMGAAVQRICSKNPHFLLAWGPVAPLLRDAPLCALRRGCLCVWWPGLDPPSRTHGANRTVMPGASGGGSSPQSCDIPSVMSPRCALLGDCSHPGLARAGRAAACPTCVLVESQS